jgi:hypothetical protein
MKKSSLKSYVFPRSKQSRNHQKNQALTKFAIRLACHARTVKSGKKLRDLREKIFIVVTL